MKHDKTVKRDLLTKLAKGFLITTLEPFVKMQTLIKDLKDLKLILEKRSIIELGSSPSLFFI